MQRALDDAVARLHLCASEIETKCAALYPPLLDDFGLPTAMGWHIKGSVANRGGRASDGVLPGEELRGDAEEASSSDFTSVAVRPALATRWIWPV
jgi:hypothetical protein